MDSTTLHSQDNHNNNHHNHNPWGTSILRIKKGQEKRIARAYKNRRGCKIVIHHQKCLDNGCCTPGRMTLSAAQQKRLLSEDARRNSEKPTSLPFTPEDLKRNGTVSGGFIPMILAAIASSVAGGLIERGIAGAGLIWKHSHGACHLKSASSKDEKGRGTVQGLHIVPYRGKFAPEAGMGIYLQPYPRGRGIFPRPALPGDVRKALKTPSQKKILRALLRQAIHEG